MQARPELFDIIKYYSWGGGYLFPNKYYVTSKLLAADSIEILRWTIRNGT